MFSRILRRTRPQLSHLVYSCTARHYSIRYTGNREIVQYLNRCLAEERESPTHNGYKLHAFKRAIQAIKDHDGPIYNGEDAKKIDGVGHGISHRIEVLLNGDQKPAIIAAIRESIPGIGLKKSKALVDHGATLETLGLPKYQAMLTEHQKTFLAHRDFINNTASREDAEQILNFCKTLLSFDGSILLVGDYRRGATELKEISLLVVGNSESVLPLSYRMPDVNPRELRSVSANTIKKWTPFNLSKKSKGMPVENVITSLRELGLLCGETSRGTVRWKGWSRVPMKHDDAWETRAERKQGIDAKQGKFIPVVISFVDSSSKGSALLALTGDVEFGSYIRKKAIMLGMFLNEYGLWKSNSSDQWTLVEASDEEAILKEVGMDFVEPEKRNFSFLHSTKTNIHSKKTKTPSVAGTVARQPEEVVARTREVVPRTDEVVPRTDKVVPRTREVVARTQTVPRTREVTNIRGFNWVGDSHP